MWFRAINNQAIKFLVVDMLYKFVIKEDGKVYVVSGDNEKQVGLMVGEIFYPSYMFNFSFKNVYDEDHPILLEMQKTLQEIVDEYKQIPEFTALRVYKRIDDILSGVIVR